MALSNGNILKSWIMACIVFCAKIMMASYWAATFTQVAANAGFDAAITALAGGTPDHRLHHVPTAPPVSSPWHS